METEASADTARAMSKLNVSYPETLSLYDLARGKRVQKLYQFPACEKFR